MYSHSNIVRYIFISVLVLSFSLLYGQTNEEAKNIQQLKRFYDEVVNKGKVDLFDELLSENFIEHEELPTMAKGREGVKEFFKMYRGAFPDLKFTVNDMTAKGDKVWAYITITGTQKGPFMDMPASGKKIEIKGFDLLRFSNGKAVEHWGVTDTAAMMQQLGAMPAEHK